MLSDIDIRQLPSAGWEARGYVETSEGRVRVWGPCDDDLVKRLRDHFADRVEDGLITGVVYRVFSDATVFKFEGPDMPRCFVAIIELAQAA